jgi:hypothetical protein
MRGASFFGAWQHRRSAFAVFAQQKSEGGAAVVRDLVTDSYGQKKTGLNEQTGFSNWRLAVTFQRCLRNAFFQLR